VEKSLSRFRSTIVSAKFILSIAAVLSASTDLTLAQAPSPAAAVTNAPTAADPRAAKLLEAIREEEFLQGLMDPFDYEPRGRKDPFAQPVLDRPVSQGASHGPLLPLQRFDLTKLKLIGIIWDVKRPRAMINDPDSKVHIVGPNTKIGTRNGYIAVIREGEIVIVETVEENGRLVSSAQIIKLAK
jgi:type IV pilus assembly protein PilP